MPLDRDAHRKRRSRQSRRSRSGGCRGVVKREYARPVSINRKVPSTIRDPPPRGLERRAGVAVHHARVNGVRPCPQSTGKASMPGMRSKALFAPCPALAKRAARDTRNVRRPVSKNRKVGTVERDPRTARRYAPNERRRPRDARLQRETASSRVGARLSAAARAGNVACASCRRLEGGWSREEYASGAITPSTDGSGRSVAENGVREKRPIRDRAVLRAE